MVRKTVLALVAVFMVVIAISFGAYSLSASEEGVGGVNETEEMGGVENLIIYVNTGLDKPNNQYASYVVAFAAKQANVPNVTVFYGPSGVEMVKNGSLASLAIPAEVKTLVADQFEGLNPEDLPDDLEALARFEKEQLGVDILSCGTFHVIDGFAIAINDTREIVDFVTPVEVPDAVNAALGADKILYF
jgi:predicted peroxiredoxin